MKKIIIPGFAFCMIMTFFSHSLILAQHPDKKHISAQELLEDSFILGKTIFESGFKPTFLVAVWRGGVSIGIAVEEYFRYRGAPINSHCSVRVSSYNHDQLKKEVVVFDLDYVANNIQADDRLLIVDDVLDSGSSVKKLLEEISRLCGEKTPKDIRIATVYYKPESATTPPPDYYLHETSSWLIFPHELEGMSLSEIKSLKGEAVHDIVK